MSNARVVSVNVGRPRTIPWRDGSVTSAIWKEPIEGRVALHGVNFDGDDQADRKAHGGPDKAVYAYAAEDYANWQTELGRTLQPGTFGENLTLSGIDVSNAPIGQRWQVGTAILEVSQPRIPCYKLGIKMDDPRFPTRFAEAERPGSYLRIIHEGSIAAGDPVTILETPTHGLTSRLVSHIYHSDHSELPRLLEVPELSESWRVWAEKMLAHSRASVAGSGLPS